MAETFKSQEESLNREIEPKVSQEEGDLRKATASPSRHQRHSAMSPGDTPKKTGVKGNVLSSSSWERKNSSDISHGLAPLTPGRSRMRSTPRGSETPDKGVSIPKFGEWDESDPSSADGYSHIFNRVREEREGGSGNTPSMAGNNGLSNGQSQFRNDNSKGCCCFPWGRN